METTIKLKAVCMAFLCLLIGACTRVSQEEVIGTYTSPFQEGTETLVLRPGGSFQQLFAPSNGPAVTNSGRWTWYDPGPAQIELWGLMITDDWMWGRSGALKRINLFGVEAIQTNGMITLNYGSEGGVVYTKVE